VTHAALFAALLHLAAPVSSESLSFVVADRAIGVSEGLPAAQVLSLYQDRTGAVWAGTTAGLARLGGPEIRVFGLADGLPRNVIYDVVEDKAGTLFVGTLGGIARFDGRSFKREPGEAGSERRVRALIAGPDGDLYALLGRDLVLRFRAGAWQSLPLPKELTIDAVALAIDAKRDLWLATRSRGLLRFTHEVATGALRLAASYGAAAGLAGDEAYFVVADGDGVAVSGRDGLLRIEADHVRRLAYPPGFETGHRVLGRAPDGRLYLGAEAGVAVVGDHGIEPLHSSRGLAQASVARLMVDRAGNLWAGTLDRGIHLLFTGTGVSFLRIGGHDLRGVDCDDAGFCWLGSDRELYRVHVDASGEPHDPVSVRGEGMLVGPIFSFEPDGAGNVLVGTENGVGMLPKQSRQGPAPVLRRDPRFVPCGDGVAPRILRDRAGVVWVASVAGLFRLDPGEALATPVTLPERQRDPAWAMMLDRLDSLWLADHAGSLWRLSPPPERRPERVTLTGASGPVEQIATTPTGDLLASFEDGSWLLVDAQTRRTRAHVAPTGEMSNLAVFSVARLRDGRAVAAHGGNRLSLVKLEPPRIEAPVVSSADLDDADFRYLTVRPTPGAPLWLATLGSVAQLRELRPPPPPNPLTIWSLRAENAAADSSPGRPRLGPRPNAVDVLLSLAEPVAPRQVRYRWRLRGETEAWSQWTSDPRVRISNLGAGDFVLEAEARDRYGRPAPARLEVPINAAPLYWETWPFRSVLLMGIVLIAWAAYRVRVGVMVREHERLEAAVAERSAELAEANRELREASLTDPLTGLKNRRYFDVSIADEEGRARRAHSLRPGEPPAANPDMVLYVVDLDHFKEVNDTWGHAAGDRVLIETARRLKAIVRQSDLLIRWGGEEFLVVSRDAKREEGARLAGRILMAVGNESFEVGDGQRTRRTCSVGWSPFPWLAGRTEGEDSREAVRRADRALYQAKNDGRNRAVGFVAAQDGALRSVVIEGPR